MKIHPAIRRIWTFPTTPRTAWHEAQRDAEVLMAAGYELDWLLKTPTFYRAVVGVDERHPNTIRSN